MRQHSLRLRLTLLVTAAFVIALAVAGLLARQQLQRSLLDSAWAAAEQTLDDSFFADPEGNGLSVDGVTRFVFTEPDGDELADGDFTRLLNQALGEQLAELDELLEQSFPAAADEVFIDPGDLEALPPDVAVEGFTLIDPIETAGPLEYIQTDTEIIVRQPSLIGDTFIDIAVSTPRQPLDESLAAFTRLTLLMLPVLGGLVALATWVTSSRVLRPVEAIRRQVAQTDSDRLDHHVPRSGNGDEIDRLAGTMNEMLDRLRGASEKQRQFVSDASHELRSPITATLATLETTSASDAGAEWPSIQSTLVNEQKRLAQLVDDLLLMASVDEGASSTTASVDLDELLLHEASRPHQKRIDVHIETPHRVLGDERLLQRCVTNLVENAVHHAASTVTVRLATTADGSAVITIDDDGPGIPADRLDTIFERFTRLDDARTRREGGAGLGLAIAQQIASSHDAEIVATNRPEGGARFELRFSSPELSPVDG